MRHFHMALFTVALTAIPISGTAVAQVVTCDALAASVYDTTRPKDVTGVPFDKLDGERALGACRNALAAQPNDARTKC